MDITSTHLIATGLVFAVSAVFAMLGLGGGMLYVPVFKWLELPAIIASAIGSYFGARIGMPFTLSDSIFADA